MNIRLIGHKARSCLCILTIIGSMAGRISGEQRRLITVEDCIRTRRILEDSLQSLPIALSPDGARVAYILKAPNIDTNRNDYQLYIRALDHAGNRENGKLLLQADRISRIKWVERNQLVAQIETNSETVSHRSIVIVNADTAAMHELEFPVPVEEVSVSSNGKMIAFSTLLSAANALEGDAPLKTASRDERGYSVPFGNGSGDPIAWPRKSDIYIGQIVDFRVVGAKKLSFVGPDSMHQRSSLSWVENLDLSPDGKYLLFKYSTNTLPAGWNTHPLVKELNGFGTLAGTHLLTLCDTASGQLRLAFNYPGAFITASWADDGRAYSVISPSPFGSSAEKQETKEASAFGRLYYFLYRFSHVFVVDPTNGRVTSVVRRDSGQPGDYTFYSDKPLAWKTHDAMIIRTALNQFAQMEFFAGVWKSTREFRLQEDGLYKSFFDSDGHVLVGVSQAMTVPPDIFMQTLETGHSATVTDLNPEYGHIALGDIEKIQWVNRFGSRCLGKLIKPVGYVPGRKYPLVLMANYTDADNFISDLLYTTAFAPQVLASAGFVVLMSQYPREDKFPHHKFPGEMGQAYNWMSMMESGIDLLVSEGLVDRNEVGLVGFSRTSWLTDFMLTHTNRKLMAASSADSGLYTYGGYFRYNQIEEMRGDESQIGGPPYGKTRKYWLEYAPPFRAEKVRTPLLMEYIGPADYGFEFFVALSRLGKPVDFFRYPKGSHPLDTPFERIASLQRNVDWFRFWMQSYEGTPPKYDVQQFVRWRALRLKQVPDADGEAVTLRRLRKRRLDSSTPYVPQRQSGRTSVLR